MLVSSKYRNGHGNDVLSLFEYHLDILLVKVEYP